MVKKVSIMAVLSMLFLPCAAIIGMAGAALYMRVKLDPIILISSWAIVFGIYGLNRFTDVEDMVNNPQRRMFYKNNHFAFHAILASLYLSVILLLLTSRFTQVHFFILLTGIAYSVRIIPFYDQNGKLLFKRLKEIPFAKSLAVALIWGNAFFTINLALYPQWQGDILEIVLFIISFTLVVFVNTNFLDIIDITGDRITEIPTIPAQYGIKNTLLFAIALPSIIWLMIIAILFSVGWVKNWSMIFLTINALYPVFYIGGYYSKVITKKSVEIVADSCAFVYSVGLLCLFFVQDSALRS